MKPWLETQLGRIPGRGGLADAIRYTLSRWPALCHFLDDGRIELDNNSVERAIRPVALGRKNHLFCQGEPGPMGLSRMPMARNRCMTCRLICRTVRDGGTVGTHLPRQRLRSINVAHRCLVSRPSVSGQPPMKALANFCAATGFDSPALTSESIFRARMRKIVLQYNRAETGYTPGRTPSRFHKTS
jgi:hypothetical protein